MGHKIGLRVVNENSTNIILGIHHKISKFHIYSYDRSAYSNKIIPFLKSYSKYTVMAYGEVMYEFCKNLFFGVEIAGGYAVIYNATSLPAPHYAQLKPVDVGFDFSSLFEHGDHKNHLERNDSPAFQININFGYFFLRSNK